MHSTFFVFNDHLFFCLFKFCKFLFIQAIQVMKPLRSNGLKGQKATSPGHRPGYEECVTTALQGQKLLYVITLLPLQGEETSRPPPRAMPWATCLLAFQAVSAKGAHHLRTCIYPKFRSTLV